MKCGVLAPIIERLKIGDVRNLMLVLISLIAPFSSIGEVELKQCEPSIRLAALTFNLFS